MFFMPGRGRFTCPNALSVPYLLRATVDQLDQLDELDQLDVLDELDKSARNDAEPAGSYSHISINRCNSSKGYENPRADHPM